VRKQDIPYALIKALKYATNNTKAKLDELLGPDDVIKVRMKTIDLSREIAEFSMLKPERERGDSDDPEADDGRNAAVINDHLPFQKQRYIEEFNDTFDVDPFEVGVRDVIHIGTEGDKDGETAFIEGYSTVEDETPKNHAVFSSGMTNSASSSSGSSGGERGIRRNTVAAARRRLLAKRTSVIEREIDPAILDGLLELTANAPSFKRDEINPDSPFYEREENLIDNRLYKPLELLLWWRGKEWSSPYPKRKPMYNEEDFDPSTPDEVKQLYKDIPWITEKSSYIHHGWARLLELANRDEKEEDVMARRRLAVQRKLDEANEDYEDFQDEVNDYFNDGDISREVSNENGTELGVYFDFDQMPEEFKNCDWYRRYENSFQKRKIRDPSKVIIEELNHYFLVEEEEEEPPINATELAAIAVKSLKKVSMTSRQRRRHAEKLAKMQLRKQKKKSIAAEKAKGPPTEEVTTSEKATPTKSGKKSKK
jgi:hypothetical protein